MQQTETYKLNKPETTDPFTPVPLNENADKLESELARVDASAAALAQRVVKLENCRIVVGWYRGNNTSPDQFIDLGERPVAVMVFYCETHHSYCGMAVESAVCADGTYSTVHKTLWLDDTGFHVTRGLNVNVDYGYCYLALLGGWPVDNKGDPPTILE